MSANITVREDGTAEIFSGNNIVPWHGLGSIVKGTVTAEEAIKLAHLDWGVEKRPIFIQRPGADGAVTFEEFKDYKSMTRKDNGLPLAVVKNRYFPVQNKEAFSFFDEIVGAGQAVYETAGSLDEGRKIWIMAKLPGTVFVSPEDKINKWVLLATSHDGSRSIWMQLVTERVVCSNTLSIALRGATNQIKIRHTQNYASRKEEAMRALDIANGYFSDLEALLKKVATVPCTQDNAIAFNERLFPATENTKGEVEVSTKTQNIRDKVVVLFNRGAGNKGQTRYDYLNAITDFVDHARTVRGAEGDDKAESRFESSMMGSGAALKQKAADLLVADLN